MREVVLDASVVLKWFGGRGEEHEDKALVIRSAYQAGELFILAPSLLVLEIVNVAARRWQWQKDMLSRLAAGLDTIGFEWREPDLYRVVRWTGAGLPAYDAAYVALAEETGTSLVTDDRLILDLAPGLAESVRGWRGGDD
jgi:predicted nucleic acid-binding protein